MVAERDPSCDNARLYQSSCQRVLQLVIAADSPMADVGVVEVVRRKERREATDRKHHHNVLSSRLLRRLDQPLEMTVRQTRDSFLRSASHASFDLFSPPSGFDIHEPSFNQYFCHMCLIVIGHSNLSWLPPAPAIVHSNLESTRAFKSDARASNFRPRNASFSRILFCTFDHVRPSQHLWL